MKNFKIKQENSLVNDAYHKLEEMIVTGELVPGSFVSENELSEHLNIGRTPVREALKRLEVTRLIAFIPRKGVLIRIISVDEQLMQLEVRTVLEDLVIKRATKFATPTQRDEFKSLASKYRDVTKNWSPAIEALRIDDNFNRLLCKVSRNPFLSDTLLPMHAMARRQYYCNYFIDKDLTKKVNLSHADLMDAIADGKIDEALKFNEILLNNIKKFNTMSMSTWFPQATSIFDI